YIVDFICYKEKLIIELDGIHHDDERQRRYDKKRTKFLESCGYRVLRFWNNEVLYDIEGVVIEIQKALEHEI
nr:DUF559 domain-containing protein [Candidatus Gracilibacteria bacterium]